MSRFPERWPAVLAAALGLTAATALTGAALAAGSTPSPVPALSTELSSPEALLSPGTPTLARSVSGRPATTPPPAAPRAVTTARTPRPTPVPQCATIRVAAPAESTSMPLTSAVAEQGCPESLGNGGQGSP